MAGVLGSMLGAPLTAIVFALGLTHDTSALLPLLLTVTVAYGFTSLVLRRSIMTEKIARRGLHVWREYGVDPLERQHVGELMSTQLVTLQADLPAQEAWVTHFGQGQRHRAYPVVRDGRLLGMLDRQDFAEVAGQGRPCADLLPPLDAEMVLLPTDTARTAAGRLSALNVSRLPVVADTQSMRLVGLLALPDLVMPAGRAMHEETHRERVR